jgi:hypothetical protein
MPATGLSQVQQVMVLAIGMMPPCVIAAGVNFEHVTEPAHRILSRMLLNERVL